MEFEEQTQERRCTGNEFLNNIETEFMDLSNLRPEYNVYKAVYALAHALHGLLQYVPGSGLLKGQSSVNLQGLESWQVCFQAHSCLNVELFFYSCFTMNLFSTYHTALTSLAKGQFHYRFW